MHSVFQVNLDSVLANKQHPLYGRYLVVCLLDKCLWKHADFLKSFCLTVLLKTILKEKVKNVFPNSNNVYFLVNFSCGICVVLELLVLPQADFSFCCYLSKYLTVIPMHFLI